MKISLKRTVIAFSAAVAMLSCVFAAADRTSITADAASGISISINPSSSTVEPGKSFTVSVGYKPGDTGAAAYEIALHYDSSKLKLNSYDGDVSPFAMPEANTKTSSSVSFLGVNKTNVTTSGTLGTATFTPVSGATGSAAFWIEVVDMADKNWSQLSVSAPSSSKPVSVTIAEATTTTTTTKTTTTTTTTTTKATTTTPKATEAPKKTTTTPKKTTTTPKVTTTPTPTGTTPEPTTTTPAPTETTPEVTDAPVVSDIPDAVKGAGELIHSGCSQLISFLKGDMSAD